MRIRHDPITTLAWNLIVCIVPATVQAQSNDLSQTHAKNFEGLALQAAVGYQPYIVNFNHIGVNNTSIKLNDQNYYNHSIPYFAGVSYTRAFGDNLTVGAQFEFNPVNQQYVLSLLPGYAFTSDIQGYLKLAWVNALVTVDQVSGQNKVSATVNGATVGLGVKKYWTLNWYGFVEANYVKMNTFKFNTMINGISLNGNVDYSGYNAMIGVGYKF